MHMYAHTHKIQVAAAQTFKAHVNWSLSKFSQNQVRFIELFLGDRLLYIYVCFVIQFSPKLHDVAIL